MVLTKTQRIQCTNKECGNEIFRPFSCKGFYLCPSCHQKRLLLLSEHLVNNVLIRYPHRQFVFTLPKSLRIFLKNDKKLFGKISKLIYKLIQEYYNELCDRKITTGMVIAYQSFGDQLRPNPHFHAIVLEGGFDSNNNFYFLPVKNMDKLTEAYRYKAIKFYEENSLISNSFANNLRSWVHSGFSVDNSISLYTYINNSSNC